MSRTRISYAGSEHIIKDLETENRLLRAKYTACRRKLAQMGVVLPLECKTANEVEKYMKDNDLEATVELKKEEVVF